MSHNTFTTARPGLLGSDTHSAEISGSSILMESHTISSPSISGSCTITNDGVWITFRTANITVNEPINEINLQVQFGWSKSSGGNMQLRLVRDGNTGSPVIGPLNIGTNTAGTHAQTHQIINETVSAHTYIWQENQTQNEGHCVYDINGYDLFSEIDESAITSSLTGANTQTAPPKRSVFT